MALRSSRFLSLRQQRDLGCGSGNATEMLRFTFNDADLIGVDSSPQQLEKATLNGKTIPYPQKMCFQHSTLAGYVKNPWIRDPPTQSMDADGKGFGEGLKDETFDVIFSSNALHRVLFPDHVIPELLSPKLLKPGGVLGFEVPVYFDEPNIRLIYETCHKLGFGPLIKDTHRWCNPPPAQWYYDTLTSVHPVLRMEIWEKKHYLLLEGTEPVPAYTKAIGMLSKIFQALGGEQSERGQAFYRVYREQCERAYPRRADGSVILPSPRLYCVAISHSEARQNEFQLKERAEYMHWKEKMDQEKRIVKNDAYIHQKVYEERGYQRSEYDKLMKPHRGDSDPLSPDFDPSTPDEFGRVLMPLGLVDEATIENSPERKKNASEQRIMEQDRARAVARQQEKDEGVGWQDVDPGEESVFYVGSDEHKKWLAERAAREEKQKVRDEFYGKVYNKYVKPEARRPELHGRKASGDTQAKR